MREIKKEIPLLCGKFRKMLGITQEAMSAEVGYSKETISGFENGRNNNMEIFLWYLDKGFSENVITLLKEIENNGHV